MKEKEYARPEKSRRVKVPRISELDPRQRAVDEKFKNLQEAQPRELAELLRIWLQEKKDRQ